MGIEFVLSIPECTTSESDDFAHSRCQRAELRLGLHELKEGLTYFWRVEESIERPYVAPAINLDSKIRLPGPRDELLVDKIVQAPLFRFQALGVDESQPSAQF